MRRKEREIKEKSELMDILNRSRVCRVGFADNSVPYIVPLNFGYQWNEKLTIFFHCAKAGKKLDLMAKNNLVCFELDVDCEIKRNEKPCEWGSGYKSIIGMGRLKKAETEADRLEGLNFIMQHYGGNDDNVFDPKTFSKTEVLALTVEEISGKSKK